MGGLGVYVASVGERVPAAVLLEDIVAAEPQNLKLERCTHASVLSCSNEVAVHELAEPEALLDFEDCRVSFLGHPCFGLTA